MKRSICNVWFAFFQTLRLSTNISISFGLNFKHSIKPCPMDSSIRWIQTTFTQEVSAWYNRSRNLDIYICIYLNFTDRRNNDAITRSIVPIPYEDAKFSRYFTCSNISTWFNQQRARSTKRS